MRDQPGHGTRLSYYEFGATALCACQADQRFSYCMYVPRRYNETKPAAYPLLVLIHGTDREPQQLRNAFVDFAEEQQCFLLAPLFPCGIGRAGELDNYKFIKHEGIRFDQVLLAMITEAAARYGVAFERFMLHGFSGGGHFAHRFLYLHPSRLTAVSIGAPGLVTLLDDTKPWWVGTGNLEAEFGVKSDVDAIRRVKIQMIVGGLDNETWEITTPKNSPRYLPGIDDTGKTRIERLQSLRKNFTTQGIEVRFDLVPGVAHEGCDPAFVLLVQDFLRSALKG